VLAGVLASGSGSGSPSGSGPGGHRTNRTTTTGPATPGGQAARWAMANLPAGTAVVARGPAQATLRALHATDRCAPDGYLLADAALRRAAAGRPDLAGCLRNSVPVARFADGAEVRRVTTDPAAAGRALAAARTDRQRGGAALLRNRSITAAPSVAAQLRAGRLDMRAETVLAVVAGRTEVHLVAVLGDPAELAAGYPARTVLITVPEPGALAAVLRAVSDDYRPRETTAGLGDSTRLTWPFRAAPPPVLR
jgi:hypothetical protein